jgi:type IV pilus assembly protein PilC
MDKSSNSKIHFKYTAKNQNIKTNGEIFAQNKQLAILMLKKKGLSNIKLSRYSSSSLLGLLLGNNKVTSRDLTLFTRQMATMQNAGLPIIRGISIVRDGSKKVFIRSLLGEIIADLESGLSFSESLKKHPVIFDELYCNLIEAGEKAGTLDTMLERIALYKEKTESTKSKVKRAMYYPMAVLVFAAIATLVLLVKVVPTFKNMFDSFGAKLPGFTLAVLGVSDFIRNNALFLLLGLTLATLVISNLYRNNIKFKNMVQSKLLLLPILGNIIHKTALARFARTLATTFMAGVPLTVALVSVAKATGNIVYYNAITNVNKKISEGQQLNKALASEKIFPNLIIQMIAIGEESGSLEQMLSKSANIYEEEVDMLVDGLSSLIEPLIMVILGLIVGSLVISMYLPIFKLGSVI